MEDFQLAIFGVLLGVLIGAGGSIAAQILANQHNERVATIRLKSEEDRWYSQRFLEHRVEAIANLSIEVNRLAREVYNAPDKNLEEVSQGLSTSCDRFYLVLLGATAYLEERDAKEMTKCTGLAEEVGKEIKARLAMWGSHGSTARTEVQDFITEEGPAVFGRALKIVNEYIPKTVRGKKA